MKLNEFSKKSKKQVNEALSDWFGDLGAAKIKGGLDTLMGKAGGSVGTAERIAREKFVNDFVGKTAFQLRDLVKSGQLSSTPAAGQTGQSQMGKTPSQSQPNQSASQNFKPQGYGSIKLNTPTGLTPQQSIKPTSAQSITATPQQPAPNQQSKPTIPGRTPSDSGAAAFSSMASNLQGINPNIQPSQATSSTSSTGGTTTKIPAQKTTDITKHQSGPFTNVAQQVARSMPKQQSRMNQGPNVWRSNRLKEDQYHKLNSIFEGLLSLDEDSNTGISNWLMKKITTYMQGYDLAQYTNTIKKYADQVETNYAAGERKIVEPLRMIGNLLYTILDTERKGQEPKAEPAAKEPVQPTTTAQPQTAGVSPYKQILNLIPNLNKAQKQRLLKTLSSM